MQRFDFDDDNEGGDQPIIAPNAQRRNGRLCEIFTGTNPHIHIDDWLRLFNLVTRRLTEEDRIEALARHVGEEAMLWLIRDILPEEDLDWEEIQLRMTTRFRRATHSFLDDAMDRELKPNESLESYFNDKRRLMRLAGVPDHNQIPMLSRGIPNKSMRTHIATTMPPDPDTWLRVALVAEANLRSRESNTERRPFQPKRHWCPV